MLVTLIIITITLVLSAFFSGMEIAFITSDKLRIELEKKKGSKIGKILSGYVEKPSIFLASILVGNNIVLVIFSIYFEGILDEYIHLNEEVLKSLSITLISTLVVLIFGEYLPKSIFRSLATPLLFAFALPFHFARKLLTPLVWIMVKTSYSILNLLFGIKAEENEQVFTKMDLEHFINNIKTTEADEIDKTIFQNALNIDSVKVKDCMIPRNEIQGMDIHATIDQLKSKFIESQNSRLIIYDKTIDEIKGYVHHQKLLENPNDIDSIMFPITVTYEFTPSRDLMKKMIKEKLNMAWVVDEFGGTAGIITLEDLLEEIVGDISDEYDQELLEEKISDNEYIFEGRLDIYDLNQSYFLQIPESEDYQTLSGFILHVLETIPEQGTHLYWNHLEFHFEKVSDTRIETVRVVKLHKADQDSIED